MQKRNYETPVMEIKLISLEDIVCASDSGYDVTKGDNEINNSDIFGFDEL